MGLSARGLSVALMAMVVSIGSSGIAATEEEPVAFVLCRSKKDVRTIRVVSDAGGAACTTLYTKAGEDKVVGGNRSLAACRSVMQSVRTNLEAASWNCRTVETARIMMGDEVFR